MTVSLTARQTPPAGGGGGAWAVPECARSHSKKAGLAYVRVQESWPSWLAGPNSGLLSVRENKHCLRARKPAFP